jgi:hypothetical protein
MSVPEVPLSAFSNLAGSSLSDDLRRLLADPELAGLVLFSDTLGEHLALLPVGAGLAYARIEDVGGAEIEGLRPLAALRLRGSAPEEDLQKREKQLAEGEKRLAAATKALAEREAQVARREQMLIEKERDFFRRSGDLARQGDGPEPTLRVVDGGRR